MPAVTPSSADQIQVDPTALPASGAAIEAAAATGIGACAGQAAASTASTALDAVSVAITASMAARPAVRAKLLANAVALAEQTAATDRASAAALIDQDSQNAATIAAASPGPAAAGHPA